MYDWQDWQDYYDDEENKPNKECRHTWIPVLLLTTTVYDCKYCGAHKEKVEGK